MYISNSFVTLDRITSDHFWKLKKTNLLLRTFGRDALEIWNLKVKKIVLKVIQVNAQYYKKMIFNIYLR